MRTIKFNISLNRYELIKEAASYYHISLDQAYEQAINNFTKRFGALQNGLSDKDRNILETEMTTKMKEAHEQMVKLDQEPREVVSKPTNIIQFPVSQTK